MAKIRVYRREAGGKYFPRVCMKCGREADCDVPNTFTWMPSWVPFLILLGLAPWLIVALVTRRTMRVAAPMCRGHAWHWRNRTLYVWLGLVFWVGYFVALFAFGDRLPEDAKTPAVLAGIFGGLFWLVTAAVYSNSAIKASLINDRGAELVNVNRDFADEWNSM